MKKNSERLGETRRGASRTGKDGRGGRDGGFLGEKLGGFGGREWWEQ